MKRFLLTSAAAVLAVQSGQASAGSVPGKPRPQMTYFLPKTVISAEVSQTLTSCPASATEAPEIETAWTILPRPVPDPTKKILIDASSGPLSKRTTALVLRPDGTLDSFNAESTGEAGPAIVSALKLGASIASVASPAFAPNFVDGPPLPPPNWACKSAVARLVDAVDALGAQIAGIDDKVLLGTATKAETQLAERLRKKRAATRQALTLTSKLKEDMDPTAPGAQKLIDPTAQADWFNPGFVTTELVGSHGFAIEVSARDPAMIPAVEHGDNTNPDVEKAKPRLVYRRPVLATIKAGPCTDNSSKCTFSQAAADASAADEAQAPIAQWSGLYSLSVRRAALFGHFEVKAKFDPFGAPLELSYGSASGAADIASALDGGTATIDTARGAELASLERAIKIEEARQKLRDLKSPE